MQCCSWSAITTAIAVNVESFTDVNARFKLCRLLMPCSSWRSWTSNSVICHTVKISGAQTFLCMHRKVRAGSTCTCIKFRHSSSRTECELMCERAYHLLNLPNSLNMCREEVSDKVIEGVSAIKSSCSLLKPLRYQSQLSLDGSCSRICQMK